MAPLVERYVTGDAHAPSVYGVAKVVRGFVRIRPGEEGDVPGLVEEVLEEMRCEEELRRSAGEGGA